MAFSSPFALILTLLSHFTAIAAQGGVPGVTYYKIQAVSSAPAINLTWVAYYESFYNPNYDKSEPFPPGPLVMQANITEGDLVNFAGASTLRDHLMNSIPADLPDNTAIAMSNVNYRNTIFVFGCSQNATQSGPRYHYTQAASQFAPTYNLITRQVAGLGLELLWNHSTFASWAVCKVSTIPGYASTPQKQLTWRSSGTPVRTKAKSGCVDVRLRLVVHPCCT